MNHHQRGMRLRLILAILGLALALLNYTQLTNHELGPSGQNNDSYLWSSSSSSDSGWSWDSSSDSGDSGWDSGGDSGWDSGGDSGSWDSGGGWDSGGDSGSW